MRLLIVDDSKIERMILKEMLQSKGHEVEEAENGEQALKKVLLSLPDIIISDILMPVMDGFKLCREIRTDQRTRDIPFVFYTGTYIKAEDEEFAFKMGADRFLVKSMEWEVFFRELRDVIKEKEMGRNVFPGQALQDEAEIYKLYNERLIKKLEEKVAELEKEVAWRKKLEKQLYDSQESLQLALDGANIGMWDWNVQTGEAKFNQQWAKYFGYTPEELQPHVSTWEKLIHPDDRQRTMAVLAENLNGTTERYECEYRLRSNTGKWYWILAKGKVVSRDESGKALRQVGTFLDISDRVEIRKALEKQKERYQLIFDTAPIGIFHYDENSVITECNPTTYNIFGASDETAISLNMMESLENEGMTKAIRTSLSGQSDHFQGAYTSVLAGKRSVIKAAFVPVFSDSQKVIGGVGVIEDISAQAKATEEMTRSEEKYRTILESIEDGYFEADLAGNLIFFNNSLCDILGYPESELTGMNYRALMDPENVKKTFKTFNQVFQTGVSLKGFDWKVIRKDGAGRYLDTSVSPVKDADGQVTAFRGISRDVSERRLMEKFLAESEERYRLIFESAPIGIFHYDKNGIIRACNQAYVDISGSSFGKLIGFNLLKTVTNQKVLEAVKKSLAGSPGCYEGEYISVTGGRKSYIKADFVPVLSGSKSLEGGMCVVEDMTERKKAEDALRKSEQEAGVLLNATTDAAVLLDPDGIVININDTFANRFNKKKEDIIGKCIWNKFPPNAASPRKENAREVFETGKPISVVGEFQGIWDHTNIFPVVDHSGKVARVAVFAQDITDRKRTEEALRESEEKYRGLAENSPGIILLVGGDGICRFISPSVEQILGYKPEEVVGTDPGHFLLPEEAVKAISAKSLAIKGEKVKSFETRISKKDGAVGVIEWEGIPVTEHGRITGVQFLGRDITDRRVAEVELEKSRQQLSALSKHLQLSREQERAGIAREIHDDLGQSLTAIKMDVAWLQSKIPEDQKGLIEKARETISLTDSAIQTVKRISSELRPGLLDDLGLSAAVEWQASEYQKRSGVNIRVAIDPEDIFLDENLSIAIFRVCQEALTNVARHSGATDAWISLTKNRNSVTLVITDNGGGISEEDIAKKDSFGLIGMRERIHAFDGKINISKIKDSGTKVAVQIPLAGD